MFERARRGARALAARGTRGAHARGGTPNARERGARRAFSRGCLFRQNVQPDGEFSAPDLIVELKRRCPPNEEYALVGRVRNVGEAPAPAGVPVYFYEGEPGNGGVQFAQGVTMNVLYPAQSEDVVVPGDMVPLSVQDGSTPVWVVVDDDEPAHPWKECRTDNNSDNDTGECKVLG